jgi:hypothetical protein
MPVGHHGSMSKHPAWVKIAILEYLEARLKDAADHPDVDIGAENVHVYDPFTTDMDFYIFVDASWSKYLKLYAKYYDQEFSGPRQKELEPDLPTKYGEKYSTRINKAIYDIGPDDTNREIFNASKSKTEIFYTIQQMKNILELEEPYP